MVFVRLFSPFGWRGDQLFAETPHPWIASVHQEGIFLIFPRSTCLSPSNFWPRYLWCHLKNFKGTPSRRRKDAEPDQVSAEGSTRSFFLFRVSADGWTRESYIKPFCLPKSCRRFVASLVFASRSTFAYDHSYWYLIILASHRKKFITKLKMNHPYSATLSFLDRISTPPDTIELRTATIPALHSYRLPINESNLMRGNEAYQASDYEVNVLVFHLLLLLLGAMSAASLSPCLSLYWIRPFTLL